MSTASNREATMKDALIIVAVLAWPHSLILCVTWRNVRHRQCECAEEIARIENGKQPTTIGFRKEP